MQLADLLQLLALLVAIIAILIIPSSFILDQQRRDVSDAVKLVQASIRQIELHREVALEMCHSLAKASQCLSQELKFHRDLIESSLSSNGKNIDVNRLTSVWTENDAELVSHLMDLAVFSPIEAERDSSFRLLAEKIGDVDSLRKMRAVASNAPALQRYCHLLEARLARGSSFRRQ